VKIGNPLQKGISGGQAKRTNIGIALITSPRVLFLDEPTSGLDSFTANEVMTVVQGLASSGVTIIATIHSPTAYAFSLFDSLMMLVRNTKPEFVPMFYQNVHALISDPQW
jgi:ABC-type multidrug transport system ATPase subunit